MALFHKNGVFTGLLESYCLPCEVHLETENDIRDHIEDLRHVNNLVTSYVDVYKDDGIRKVPQGYYCEYCNKIFLTIFSVRMHVAKVEHQRAKDTQWLRKQGDKLIVLNQLAVDDDSWHGLIDGACALCNSEYLDKEAHKTITSHIHKLIQSTVELHSSGAVYREGDDYFHCLICNAIFSSKSLLTHFEQSAHLQLYNKCRESFINLATVNINDTILSEDNTENNSVIGTAEDTKEISHPKSTKNYTIYEQHRYIKNMHQSSHLQGSSDETITPEAVEESLQKHINENDGVTDKGILEQKSINKEQIYENESNKITETFTKAPESIPTQETTESSQKTMPESLLKIEHENDMINDKEIVENQFIHHKQIFKEETNAINENHSKIIASETFQTQQIIESLQKDLLELLSNNESDNDTVKHKDTPGKQSTNKQVYEKQNNELNKNYSKIVVSESFITQQPLPEYKNEMDGVNDREISKQESTNNKQVSETTTLINEHDCSTPENIQTRQASDTFKKSNKKKRPLLQKEKENTTGNDKVSEQNSYNDQTSKRTEIMPNDNHAQAVAEQCFGTQQIVESNIAQEGEDKALSKKEKFNIIARENKIRCKDGYTKAFCSICLTNISSSLKSIKRHVDSINHKNAALKIPKHVSNVTPMHKFAKQLMFIELKPFVIDVIINNSHCIDFSSYLLMTKHDSYIRCYVCNVNFNVGLFDDHRNSETHNGALQNIPVVYSLLSEFVREVEPGYYHCGFCNMFEGSWVGLSNHCKSQSHLKQKSLSNERLQYVLSKKK